MKKLDKEEDEREEEEESVWDVNKIIVGIVIFAILIAGAWYAKQQYYPDLQLIPNSMLMTGKQVRGASIEETPEQKAEHYTVQNIKASVQDKIDSLASQANNLNAAEVATSSPQVQKVLEDLKNLQNYPKNQAKQMCMNVCNGL